MRNTLHDGIEDFVDTLARLSAGADNLRTVAAYQVYNLVLDLVGHSRRHVDLVDDGDDLEVVVDSHIEVRDGLCLHALRGVDHQQRALAGSNRARHLVAEVYVSRRVDQIECVFLSILYIFHLYGVALDGDAALALQIHIVKHLSLSHLYGLCTL